MGCSKTQFHSLSLRTTHTSNSHYKRRPFNWIIQAPNWETQALNSIFQAQRFNQPAIKLKISSSQPHLSSFGLKTFRSQTQKSALQARSKTPDTHALPSVFPSRPSLRQAACASMRLCGSFSSCSYLMLINSKTIPESPYYRSLQPTPLTKTPKAG